MSTTAMDESLEVATVHKDPAYARGISSDDRHVPTQHSRTDDVELGMSEKAELPGAAESPVGKETGSLASESKKKPSKMGRFYRKYKIYVHSFIFLLVTG